MQGLQAFIFDIDGVIHVQGKAVPGAAETLDALRAAGKKLLFMTNNAMKTQTDVANQLRKLGATVCEEEVMTSSLAASNFVKSKGLQGRPVYVFGVRALEDALKDIGEVCPFGGEADVGKSRDDCLSDFVPSMDPPPEDVAAVVVGADPYANFYKVARAANYLRLNPSCLFVATNPDPRALLGPDRYIPAGGSWVACIATAAGRQPDIVCGKPNVELAKYLLELKGFDAATTCMVGDRTDTDVEFGRSAGMHTLFVESGSMSLDEAVSAGSAHPEQLPHFSAPSIAVLRDLLPDRP